MSMPTTYTIALNGTGGELDRVEITGTDVTVEQLQYAVCQLAMRCVLSPGDTITITEIE